MLLILLATSPMDIPRSMHVGIPQAAYQSPFGTSPQSLGGTPPDMKHPMAFWHHQPHPPMPLPPHQDEMEKTHKEMMQLTLEEKKEGLALLRLQKEQAQLQLEMQKTQTAVILENAAIDTKLKQKNLELLTLQLRELTDRLDNAPDLKQIHDMESKLKRHNLELLSLQLEDLKHKMGIAQNAHDLLELDKELKKAEIKLKQESLPLLILQREDLEISVRRNAETPSNMFS